MRSLLLSVALLAAIILSAQDGPITVKIPMDTVGVGQTFRVEWTVHGLPDSIRPPRIETNWRLAQGPFQGSSMKSENGVVTNSKSWTYELQASTPGPVLLPIMQARVQGRWYSSPSIQIMVTVEPRPDSILRSEVDRINAGPMVPVTGYQPLLIQINGNAGQVAVQDPGVKLFVHMLDPKEVRWLTQWFQEQALPKDLVTTLAGVTATLGKKAGSVSLSIEAGRRHYELSARQAKKLEAEVRKLLKKK